MVLIALEWEETNRFSQTLCSFYKNYTTHVNKLKARDSKIHIHQISMCYQRTNVNLTQLPTMHHPVY